MRGAEGVDIAHAGATPRRARVQVEARWDATDGFLFSCPAVLVWPVGLHVPLGIECVRIGNLSVSASRDMPDDAYDRPQGTARPSRELVWRERIQRRSAAHPRSRPLAGAASVPTFGRPRGRQQPCASHAIRTKGSQPDAR